MPHIIPASQVNELSGGENVRGDWHKLTHPHPLTATYSGNTRMLRKTLKYEQISFAGTANKPQNFILNYLKIFCKMAVRGILTFYNGQTQAEGYQR